MPSADARVRQHQERAKKVSHLSIFQFLQDSADNWKIDFVMRQVDSLENWKYLIFRALCLSVDSRENKNRQQTECYQACLNSRGAKEEDDSQSSIIGYIR